MNDKRTSKPRKPPSTADELRPEYTFDYRTARQNRFAASMGRKTVVVVLEPDVAKVFDTSDSVNRLLRSVISAVPTRARRTPASKTRRKAG